MSKCKFSFWGDVFELSCFDRSGGGRISSTRDSSLGFLVPMVVL